jgi:hypothetical protein
MSQQCPQPDTIINDTALYRLPGQDGGVNLYCGPYECITNAQFDYSVDVTVNDSASVLVFGMEATGAHFAIYDTTCTYKLWDTCGIWFYPDNIQMRDTVRLPTKYRLVITPDGSGPIAVSYIQVFSSATGRISMPDQCDPNSVENPASPGEPTYLNPSTGIGHGIPLPAGLWIRRWPGTLKPSDLIHVRPQ